MKKYLFVVTGLATIGLGIFAFAEDNPASTTQETSEIRPYNVGEHLLHIPSYYVINSGDEQSALLHSYYPGGVPILESRDELIKQGSWYKRVRILITDLGGYEKYEPEKSLSRIKKWFQATHSNKKQHELDYYTQPNNVENSRGDVWVESEKVDSVSYITCSKDNANKASHCSHHFHQGAFDYEISYDKRFLPEWKSIRRNILNLIEGFKSKVSAKAYLEEQMEGTI